MKEIEIVYIILGTFTIFALFGLIIVILVRSIMNQINNGKKPEDI